MVRSHLLSPIFRILSATQSAYKGRACACSGLIRVLSILHTAQFDILRKAEEVPVAGCDIKFECISNHRRGKKAQENIVERKWLFGDGNQHDGNDRFPVHVYTREGEFRVQLFIKDKDGERDKYTQYLQVRAPDQPPNAQFKARADTQNPLMIKFTDKSNDDHGIRSRYWEFGDGHTSTEEMPRHTYAESGSYDVMLCVEDTIGQKASAYETLIVKHENAAPEADFKYTYVDNTFTVNFVSHSKDDEKVATHQWDFGDGEFSSEVDPVHTYASHNRKGYCVTLTVADEHGLTDDYSDTVVVEAVDNAPSSGTSRPFFFKMAQNLDLRCVLVPAPWVLGPKHVSIRPRL